MANLAVLISNMLYAAQQFLVFIILARWIGPQVLGQFSLILAVTAPVYLFFGFGARRVLACDVTSRYRFIAYLKVRALTSAISFVVSVIILHLVLDKDDSLSLAYIIVVSKSVESLSDICLGQFQKYGKLLHQSFVVSIKAVISGVVFFGLVVHGHSLVKSLFFVTMISMISLAFVELPLARSVEILNHKTDKIGNRSDVYKSILKMVQNTVSLGLAELVDSLNPNVPRYAVKYYCGAAMLGVYSAIFVFMQAVGATVLLAFSQIVTPKLAMLYKGGNVDDFYSKGFSALLCLAMVGLIGVLGAWSCHEWIVCGLLGKAYLMYSFALVWIVAATGLWFLSTVVTAMMTAMDIYIHQLVAFVGMLLTTIICAIVFVPSFGVYGGAASLCFGMSVRFVLSFGILLRIKMMSEFNCNT